jgi:hypothetical protein
MPCARVAAPAETHHSAGLSGLTAMHPYREIVPHRSRPPFASFAERCYLANQSVEVPSLKRNSS